MSDKGHCCGNCRFFRADNETQGQCRKNPPLGQILMLQRPSLAGGTDVNPQPLGYWPIAVPSNWCGAWESAAPTEGAT